MIFSFKGDESEITRGLWFYEQDWQPLEEDYSQQLEAEHMSKFLGRRLDEFVPSPLKGKKPGTFNLTFLTNSLSNLGCRE